MTSILLRLIGERNAGRLDYFLGRKSADAWGPLNGQQIRQRVYADIMKRIEFQAIVETGTFRGTTTEYFAKSGLPVYTVEIDQRSFAYAYLRFRKRRDRVRVFQGNSPDFLRQLVDLAAFPKFRVFFYLDAHAQDSSRYHKAPLVEELDIIFSHWEDPVVMIDDFQVPGKAYSFDDWGPGRNLCLEALEPLNRFRISAFFPALDATEETGAKRGWVVLCRHNRSKSVLNEVENLQAFGSGI